MILLVRACSLSGCSGIVNLKPCRGMKKGWGFIFYLRWCGEAFVVSCKAKFYYIRPQV